MELLEICQNAKELTGKMGTLDTNTKNQALLQVADGLVKDAETILAANQEDVLRGKKNGMPEGLLDRLMLNQARIEQMAEGIRQVAALDDLIGEVLFEKKRPNGLMIGKKRVPLGVVGIIYEARPNVTADAFALCFKTGNVVILKGGSDAISSNIAIVSSIRKSLKICNLPEQVVSLIEDTSRETAAAFMKMNEYVDVLIPRGGAGLIRAVVNQATIPVIETGTGNCHVFVDESADFEMAIKIILNAKTQRIGVCNACESLVIHEKIVDAFMPQLVAALQEKNVEVRADEASYEATLSQKENGIKKELLTKASEADFGTEYLDYKLSVKTVASVDEAIAHINRYNTGHSETIVTNNYQNAEQFLNEVDAACVYVNASTRFTDGFEFGFGAEIGISTQKLHARGPMGLEALTSTKYVIRGNGQIRE
ncbi:glutamate-5-semialdehyde dehydrogenase [Roseburia sp. 831b]|uniref:glutamate-5-semialdehyde dehydrogenase n=1 Tax=Roseburia sp. 831b TaxID=1261635 RepID=UPI000951D73E|nr:glutamate-5-semialdehyde dehydrogenase [Roseburia sp. 831b]WVK74025.1 glutamate-5-semialdehyde dehydrogenase [Roseburia sp. 831b]